ncbi:MAG: phosphodiesterase YaeI [Chloroflexi bacterium ADurb.Bin360]|nr:MAG: phosphodiesterase YaeI [Chloroflexi bacterium ADurb.Bin360]
MSEMVARTGWPCSPNTSHSVTGQDVGAGRSMPRSFSTSAILPSMRPLWLMGVTCTVGSERDAAALAKVHAEIPAGAPTILLYHTPDLMPQVVDLGIDLYLAGHTHGGQLCLPFYGALFTSSQWGKKYEGGRTQEGQTTLYVSRGLGMEGLGAPRARLLAPPELILWELRNASDA